MVASKYQGVSCHEGRDWVAQSRTAAAYKQGFTTETKAATWLAAKLGVSLSSLRRKPSAPRVGSTESKELVLPRFHGVVPRFRSSGVLWEARAKGKLLQTFLDEQDAAVKVAAVLGVPVKRLKRRIVFRALYARAVFKASYRVFKKYVAGDAQHLERQERECLRHFRQDCLVFACLLLLSCVRVLQPCLSRLSGVRGGTHTHTHARFWGRGWRMQ